MRQPIPVNQDDLQPRADSPHAIKKERDMKHIALLVLLLGVSTSGGAQSMGGSGMMGAKPGGQSGMDSMMGRGGSGGNHLGGSPKPSETAILAGGEVRKVDKDAQKITIKHGPIRNLDMPGMTMVFRVKDPAMLDQVKAGDSIVFAADNIGGALTVTQIESAK
jgi:Cu(I)/Ag(I) efflux system periplasmic protein CusF